MFITYVSSWLYQVMQLPIPIVLSPNHIYSISLWNVFIGSLLLGIFLLLIERTFDGFRYSDFRIDMSAPATNEVSKTNASNDLSGYDNIGRKRFPGNSARSKSSMGQRIVKNKSKYISTEEKAEPYVYKSKADYLHKKFVVRKEDE